MDIGGGNGEAGDQPRPAQVNVNPEAIESLPTRDILSKGSIPSEALAAVGPGELTDGKGEAVHQSKGRDVSDGAQGI